MFRGTDTLFAMCSWYICPFCEQQLWLVDKHPSRCRQRRNMPVPKNKDIKSACDARWPLVKRWNIGMELPTLAADGSARMVVYVGHVMLCAKDTHEITHEITADLSQPAPLAPSAELHADDAAPTLTIEESPTQAIAAHRRASHPLVSSDTRETWASGSLFKPTEFDTPSPAASGSMPSPAADCFAVPLFASSVDAIQTTQFFDHHTRLNVSGPQVPDQSPSGYEKSTPAADQSSVRHHQPSTVPKRLSAQPGPFPRPTLGADHFFGSGPTSHRPLVTTPTQQYPFGGQYGHGHAIQSTNFAHPPLGVFQPSEQDVANWALLELLNLTQPTVPMPSSTQPQMPAPSAPSQHAYITSAFGPPSQQWQSLDVPSQAAVSRPAALSPTTQVAPMISTRAPYRPVPATLPGGIPSRPSVPLHSTGQSDWTTPHLPIPPYHGHPSNFATGTSGHSYTTETTPDIDWDTRLSFDPAFSDSYGP